MESEVWTSLYKVGICTGPTRMESYGMQNDSLIVTDEKREVQETLVVYPVSRVFYVADFSLSDLEL